MKARYGPRAWADFQAIEHYLSERSVAGAAHVLRDISDSIRTLLDQPQSGHPTMSRVFALRSVVATAYRIFYREAKEVLQILHVRHPSRGPLDLKS